MHFEGRFGNRPSLIAHRLHDHRIYELLGSARPSKKKVTFFGLHEAVFWLHIVCPRGALPNMLLYDYEHVIPCAMRRNSLLFTTLIH
jgi:hypothetical protein